MLSYFWKSTKTQGDDCMYFIDEEHEENYKWIMKKMMLNTNQDVQYEATVYMAAVPQIFRLIEKEKVRPSNSPLFLLTEWDEKIGNHEFTHPGLTGSTKGMCEFAISLFGGEPVSLDSVVASAGSAKFKEALVQSFKIRAKMK